MTSNWKRKYQAVRLASGIGKRQQDILRHTYATAYLEGKVGSMQDLLLNMGHSKQGTTLDWYKGAMELLRPQNSG
ncbi:MAG: hypothetical protein LR015_13590 [Verrucomicrobia bacterium]|nr:hypothetical protein [Verrucomicrobiota bacterium]